jgi:GH24 family phage-related lysozyme (muramidase)
MKRKLGRKGLDLIKSFESFVPYVYDDLLPPVKGKYREWNGGTVKGTLTIGYGHTDAAKHPLKIEKGLRISEAKALEILDVDLDECEEAVNRLVKVDLTQGQFDALVSFTFNCGTGNLQKSSLLKKLNARDYDGARASFDLYTRSKGKVLKGLVRRRDAEQALWGDTVEAVALPEKPVVNPVKVDAPCEASALLSEPDDTKPHAAPGDAPKTGISEGAKVGIGAGILGMLTQAWETITQAPETLLQAGIAAASKPAFWVFAVVIGAGIYVWIRRSNMKKAPA